ncbi:response regulator [Myxococcota bacterium]|nr:response regulator [Myxococcota bacterium]MBU1379654.1 response regulator [Myxococcota bacterium]MBU1497989.1 response regulator [Myxococcota bacterium]
MEKTPVGVTTVCSFTGLPVLSIPLFTDKEIDKDCIVTINKIGEAIIFVDYRGHFKNCQPEKMDNLFRDFCKQSGISDKYVIVINLRTVKGFMPAHALKSQVSTLLSHGDSLSGIVMIQDYSRVKKIILKGLRFFNPGLKIEVKEDYASAVFTALEIINEHKIKTNDALPGTSEKIVFEDVFFNPEWEYRNEANLRYRLGGISGKLFYISMHGNLTQAQDIHRCGALLEKVIKDNNFSNIPFIMVDYTELAPINSIRLRHLFAKEAERVNRLYGHDKSVQIAIRPDRINKIAIRLFAPFIQQRIILVNDLDEAFYKLNNFISSGEGQTTVRDIVVSKKDLKELANVFGAMHWQEDINFPGDLLSPENPLSCLSDSLLNMKKGLAELMANETLIQKQRLKESEIARRKIRKMLRETENARSDLEKSTTSKRILLDNIPTQIWYLTDENTYGAVNKAHADFMGKDIDKLAFKRLDECIAQDKVNFIRELSKPAFSGNKVSSREEWLTDYQGEKHFLSISQTPIFHSGGSVDYVVCCAEDITARKTIEEEREKLSAELIQSRKLESIGRLAGGVAHDFNNMLSVILGHVELALSETEPENSLYHELSSIQRAAERSADLTRQLLAFARKQIIAPKVIDVNSTVSGMLGMIRRLIGEDIELIFEPFFELWPVKVDPAQVDQMLANLCLNARDAMGGGGKITIQTSNISFSQGDVMPEKDMEFGRYIRLSVSDNGNGMSEETLSHIFEPFFTTKGVGKGTGLGLATIYGAVKQNSGYIKIDSEEKKGTQVMIYLPVCEDLKTPVKKADDPEIKIIHGSETVLLVEDELMILNVTAGMLENMGYQVLKARTPNDALRICKNIKNNIDILMTDVIMPGMNGRDLSALIMEMRPSIHRLFMSGYTADVIASKGILEDGVNFIHKPFSMSELSAKIHEILKGN